MINAKKIEKDEKETKELTNMTENSSEINKLHDIDEIKKFINNDEKFNQELIFLNELGYSLIKSEKYKEALTILQKSEELLEVSN